VELSLSRVSQQLLVPVRHSVVPMVSFFDAAMADQQPDAAWLCHNSQVTNLVTQFIRASTKETQGRRWRKFRADTGMLQLFTRIEQKNAVTEPHLPQLAPPLCATFLENCLFTPHLNDRKVASLSYFVFANLTDPFFLGWGSSPSHACL
jgi:hypothetical protein